MFVCPGCFTQRPMHLTTGWEFYQGTWMCRDCLAGLSEDFISFLDERDAAHGETDLIGEEVSYEIPEDSTIDFIQP